MKKKKIIVVYSSHLSDEHDNNFNLHIKKTIGTSHEFFSIKNHNQYSLNEVYNQAFDKYSNENDIIFTFIHNDIYFKTQNWGKILLRKFNNFDVDIIGVAGTDYLGEDGVWWNKKHRMFGAVEHTDGGNSWLSDYGSEFKGLQPVVVIDGVFMAVNPDNIIHKFDENISGFHFYDISFCFNNYIDGCEIAVTNEIRILHKSIGVTNKEWDLNRKLFVQKNKQFLPLTILEDD